MLVMNSVISGPMPNTSLVGHWVHKHEENSQRKTSFIGSVSPESVSAAGNTKTSDRPKHKSPQKSISMAVLKWKQTNNTRNVGQRDINQHGPIDILLSVMASARSNTVWNIWGHSLQKSTKNDNKCTDDTIIMNFEAQQHPTAALHRWRLAQMSDLASGWRWASSMSRGFW